MVLGGGEFGRLLGHEGGALMNGISALIKEPQRDPCPFHHVWLQRKESSLGNGPHQTLSLLAPLF